MSERADSWCTNRYASYVSSLMYVSGRFPNEKLKSLEDEACHNRFSQQRLQLQFTPCEALPSVWIGFAWQYSQACGHPCCLCTFSYPISFSYPVNFAFNMLWYSTPWTATPFSNDPLWQTLCGGCQWSSSGPLPRQQCSSLLWFQRTRDTQDVYCMDGHLLKLKCKYSNILRYWIMTFISCKL